MKLNDILSSGKRVKETVENFSEDPNKAMKELDECMIGDPVLGELTKQGAKALLNDKQFMERINEETPQHTEDAKKWLKNLKEGKPQMEGVDLERNYTAGDVVSAVNSINNLYNLIENVKGAQEKARDYINL